MAAASPEEATPLSSLSRRCTCVAPGVAPVDLLAHPFSLMCLVASVCTVSCATSVVCLSVAHVHGHHIVSWSGGDFPSIPAPALCGAGSDRIYRSSAIFRLASVLRLSDCSRMQSCPKLIVRTVLERSEEPAAVGLSTLPDSWSQHQQPRNKHTSTKVSQLGRLHHIKASTPSNEWEQDTRTLVVEEEWINTRTTHTTQRVRRHTHRRSRTCSLFPSSFLPCVHVMNS